MPSKRCKRICKARAKAKVKVTQKQVVSQKVIVNVGVQPRRRRKGKARKKSGRAVPKGGAYYDPFPSRLLAFTLQAQNRGMPQFRTPRAAAERPAIPGVVRPPAYVDVDAYAGDLLGGRAMPNRWRNMLGQDAWDAEGIDPTLTHIPTMTHAPSSVGTASTTTTILPGQAARRQYHTRYHIRQLAREGAAKWGGAMERFVGPARDLVEGFLGIGHPEPAYAHQPAPSSMSGSSIGGGTASSGSAYSG